MSSKQSARKRVAKHPKVDPYQAVTDTILNHLKDGVVPWRQPWNRTVGIPQNFKSGQSYQGINLILLGCRQYASPYWLTVPQANMLNGRVRKGERGSTIVKYGTYRLKSDIDGGPDDAKQGYYLKQYSVFNALQIEGIEFPEIESGGEHSSPSRLKRAEELVSKMPQKPKIFEGKTVKAAYCISTDSVEIPFLKKFENAEGYYLTLFHELIHSTGHPSRLNRRSLKESNQFGDTLYSKEELVAEMGAAFLGMEADIVSDRHEQSAAYLNGWLKVLKDPDNKRWIVQAASRAGKASDYILGKVKQAS